MPYIKFTEQEKESANSASIVDYLTSHGESVKRTGREYVWEAPSGKVSIHGSEWYSQYELVGGGAIGFVQKYFGLSYPDAVRSLLGSGVGTELKRKPKVPKKEERIPFELPKKNVDMRKVYGYLIHERLIDRDVITRFVSNGLIYEDEKYHNAVFVGKDTNGVPVHAHKRATSPVSDFKGNLVGSIAEYSFHFTGTSEYLFVFEAPIDMLAYISMNKQGWENHSYVALCSTSDRAAIQMLKDNPHLKTVYLCLDHDGAGIEGCYRVAESVHALGEYKVWRKAPHNKDWDEDLKERDGREYIPSSENTKLEYINNCCSELQNYSVASDDTCFSFIRYPNDVVEDGLYSLQRLLGCKQYYEMAKTCLAICYFRDKMIGKNEEMPSYVSRIKESYKPHHDTESSSVIADSIRKTFAQIKKELQDKDACTAYEINKQNGKVLTLALDCLRYCGAVEREYEQAQKKELAASVALTM